MKYKYVIEEINKRNKPLKWIAMLSSMFGLYFTIVVTGIILIFIYNIVIVLIVLGIIGLLGLSIMIFVFIRMFPRIEKMPYYKTGGFLREHINTTTGIIMLLFFIFLNLPGIVIGLFMPFLTSLPFIGFLFINFAMEMIFLGFLLLYIVPFGLKLPNGKEAFKQFLSSIGLTKVKPLWKNIIIGVSATVILLISLLLFGILLGSYTFNLDLLFGPPINIFFLGWFRFFFGLRPGIWEEVTFRGAILNLQRKKYEQWVAIILNGVIFGLFHLVNLIGTSNPLPVYLQAFYASCIGISLSYMFIKTKSLLPCILTHYLFDVFTVLFTPYAFPNEINYALFSMLGAGIVPAILTILLVYFLSRKNNSRL